VGEGYNKFDKKEQNMTIFRWGFPGKDRKINLIYSIQDIQAIRVEIKEGINPTRAIYVRIRDKTDIPLSAVRHQTN